MLYLSITFPVQLRVMFYLSIIFPVQLRVMFYLSIIFPIQLLVMFYLSITFPVQLLVMYYLSITFQRFPRMRFLEQCNSLQRHSNTPLHFAAIGHRRYNRTTIGSSVYRTRERLPHGFQEFSLVVSTRGLTPHQLPVGISKLVVAQSVNDGIERRISEQKASAQNV